MMADDPRLAGLNGGYRLPFDPRPAIQALGADPSDREAWDSLSEELHHQGDVGEASYAAVVLLARAAQGWLVRPWELFALVTTIKVERQAITNPAVPDWFSEDYSDALVDLRDLALDALRGEVDRLIAACRYLDLGR